MKICVGDIVERKQRPGKALRDAFGRLSAKMMFYDGFFLVIQIVESPVNTAVGDKKMAVARIMCSSGQMSWIHIDNLRKV